MEEAWRIVDSALQAGTPVFEYEPQAWGPNSLLKKAALMPFVGAQDMLREPQHERGTACARRISAHPEALEGGAETLFQRAAKEVERVSPPGGWNDSVVNH